MNLRALYDSLDVAGRERLATAVDTSPGYLYLLALGHRKPSPRLAKLLVEADDRLTLAELRDDIWGEAA